MKLDLSPESWGRVVLSTIVGTVVCVAAAVGVDSFNFAGMGHAALLRALLIDILLPIVLAVPLLLFFAGKLRELAIAHRRLTIFASTDGLTQVMNRAAFSLLVEAYLDSLRDAEPGRRGALLIIDADDFKSINDHFGHDRGDEALIAIARAIKSSLRTPDIVGRLGGEEFGVFLPDATTDQAERIAERIRLSINNIDFRPARDPHPLSVSVGGAAFNRRLPFNELFRLADQQLYAAKQRGRNRVSMSGPVRNDGRAAA